MGFGAIIFKQPYFENGDQTRFFKIMDTSVQCLNTEHCVLKIVTKRALSVLWNSYHKSKNYFTPCINSKKNVYC